MIYLRQSTASQEVPLGYFVDATDGNTEETGLTIANTDIKIWKTGATTLANKNSGGATHISNGLYYTVLDSTDTDTIGPLVLFAHVTGALAVRVECCVLDEAVYDWQFGTTAPTTVSSAIGSVTAGVSVAVGGITTTSFGAGAIDAAAIAADAIGSAELAASAVTEIQAGLSTVTTAQINAEVVDALSVDTYAEPGQGAPPATASLVTKINFMHKLARNKITQDATTLKIYADNETTVDHKTAVSDNGTTYTRGEIVAGP